MPAHRLWMKSGASGRAVDFNHSPEKHDGNKQGDDFHT